MQIQPRNSILIGDAAEKLAGLPDNSIDCVVTSPPFFQMRDYGVRGQIGLESSVEEWVESLRAVFTELARVLTPGGAVWVDLADGYSHAARYGPIKSLLLAPERLLWRLVADDGWIIRNRVIWAKTSPMPSGVGDRLETTYDVVNMLVRSRRYFFDLDAIREPLGGDPAALGKNPGDVWQIEKARFRGAHFATFPDRLVERPILATCPAKVCLVCGAPWKTCTSKEYLGQPVAFKRDRFIRQHPVRYRVIRRGPQLAPTCTCQAGARPGVVLDPFFGTGTVGAVAERLGRDWLGIELNPTYCAMAWKRVRGLPIRRPK
jgi:DNA modification methylase